MRLRDILALISESLPLIENIKFDIESTSTGKIGTLKISIIPLENWQKLRC